MTLLFLTALVLSANAFHLGRLSQLPRSMQTARGGRFKMSARPADEWSESLADAAPPAVAVLPPQSQSESILAAEAEAKVFDDSKFYGAIIGGERIFSDPYFLKLQCRCPS